MSSTPKTEEIAGSARWLAQALDPASNLVRLIEMDRQSYRAASFLDDRMLQQPVRQEVVAWGEVAAAVSAGARSDARWIFHIGHVGSTLVARLLGELAGVLSVREPRILRDVALLPSDRRALYSPSLRKLLSRTFEESETALVKATSFVSEIAPELLPPGERALLMYAAPGAYVAGILAGENTRMELRHLADYRRQRLAGRAVPLDGADSSEAHLAAAAWACEMTAMESAAEAMADRRLHWADFDILLEDSEASLADIAIFLGFEAEPDRIKAIARGPLMRRYSKAPEYDYSPTLRRELLGEATRQHRADIDSALAMLHRAAEKSPLLERALGRSLTES